MEIFKRRGSRGLAAGDFAPIRCALAGLLWLGWGVGPCCGQTSLLDSSFVAASAVHPGRYSAVEFVGVQSTSNLLILETYQQSSGAIVEKLSRLYPNGSLDTNFHSSFVGARGSQATILPGDNIFIMGAFNQFDGAARTNLVRLNADGTLDTNFASHIIITSPELYAVAVQPDGKVLVSGYSVLLNGTAWPAGVFRLNPDESLDDSFNPSINGSTFCLAVQTDGRILIGGDFTSVDGVTRAGIARLNADGSLDPTFNYTNAAVEGFAPQVRAIALQDDSQILAVGQGLSLSRLVRLNADGSVDTSFDAGFINGDFGYAILNAALVLPQPDGTVLIGGDFTAVDGVNRKGIARLMADGTLDLGFDPGSEMNPAVGTAFEQVVWALARQPDGKVLLGGTFAGFDGLSLPEMVRLNPGTPSKASLLNIWNGYRNAVSVNEDATNLTLTIVRAGNTSSNVTVQYRTVGGTAVPDVNYLPQSGVITFAPGVRMQTIALSVLDDHQVSGDKTFQVYLTNVTGGALLGQSSHVTVTVADVDLGIEFAETNYFTDVQQTSASIPLQLMGTHLDGYLYFHAPISIDYATSDGTAQAGRDYDPTSGTMHYSPSWHEIMPPPPSLGIALHDDVTAYGDHTVLLTLRNPSSNLVLGALSNAVLTIKNDNTAAGVEVGLSGPIKALVVQPDGKVVIGGEFTLIDGKRRNHLARLNPDTTLDSTFDPGTGTDGKIQALALQTDGKIIVGGTFTNLNGVSCGRITRLNPDGSVDANFNSGAGWTDPLYANDQSGVTALAVQPDGKILSGGPFSSFNGIPRPGIARLNLDGSLDTNFVPQIQTSRWFGISGLVLLPGGQVLAGGLMAVGNPPAQATLVRMNSDGAVDTNSVWPNALPVWCLRGRPNGKVLVGGTTGYANTIGLEQFNLEGTLDPMTSFDLWMIAGAVNSISLQADGKILLGGALYYGSNYNGPQPRAVARLNTDGPVDPTFSADPALGGSQDIALLPNGTILVAATFSEDPNRPPFYLRRLNPDGSDVQDLHFLPPVLLPNGQLHLALRGQWSKPYALQVSEDLTNWVTVATNDRPHVPIGYIDYGTSGFRQRFYRVD